MYRYSIVPQPDQFQQHLAKLFIRSAAKELKLTWEPLLAWFEPNYFGEIVRDDSVCGFANSCRICVKIGLSTSDLRRIIRHELRNVADLRRGQKEYQFFNSTEKQLLELSAEGFSSYPPSAEELVLLAIGANTMSEWEKMQRATRAVLARGITSANAERFTHEVAKEMDAIEPGWRSRTSAEVPCDLQAEYERLQDPFLENWEKAIIQRRIKGIR